MTCKGYSIILVHDPSLADQLMVYANETTTTTTTSADDVMCENLLGTSCKLLLVNVVQQYWYISLVLVDPLLVLVHDHKMLCFLFLLSV